MYKKLLIPDWKTLQSFIRPIEFSDDSSLRDKNRGGHTMAAANERLQDNAARYFKLKKADEKELFNKYNEIAGDYRNCFVSLHASPEECGAFAIKDFVSRCASFDDNPSKNSVSRRMGDVIGVHPVFPLVTSGSAVHMIVTFMRYEYGGMQKIGHKTVSVSHMLMDNLLAVTLSTAKFYGIDDDTGGKLRVAILTEFTHGLEPNNSRILQLIKNVHCFADTMLPKQVGRYVVGMKLLGAELFALGRVICMNVLEACSDLRESGLMTNRDAAFLDYLSAAVRAELAINSLHIDYAKYFIAKELYSSLEKPAVASTATDGGLLFESWKWSAMHSFTQDIGSQRPVSGSGEAHVVLDLDNDIRNAAALLSGASSSRLTVNITGNKLACFSANFILPYEAHYNRYGGLWTEDAAQEALLHNAIKEAQDAERQAQEAYDQYKGNAQATDYDGENYNRPKDDVGAIMAFFEALIKLLKSLLCCCFDSNNKGGRDNNIGESGSRKDAVTTSTPNLTPNHEQEALSAGAADPSCHLVDARSAGGAMVNALDHLRS